MARWRLSQPAEVDLRDILSESAERWGVEGQRRYSLLLASAMRMVAVDPLGPLTRERTDLLAGVRSFHLRHARGKDSTSRVRRPAHVLYYRVMRPELVEIVRVLHERMETTRHLGAISDGAD